VSGVAVFSPLSCLVSSHTNVQRGGRPGLGRREAAQRGALHRSAPSSPAAACSRLHSTPFNSIRLYACDCRVCRSLPSGRVDGVTPRPGGGCVRSPRPLLRSVRLVCVGAAGRAWVAVQWPACKWRAEGGVQGGGAIRCGAGRTNEAPGQRTRTAGSATHVHHPTAADRTDGAESQWCSLSDDERQSHEWEGADRHTTPQFHGCEPLNSHGCNAAAGCRNGAKKQRPRTIPADPGRTRGDLAATSRSRTAEPRNAESEVRYACVRRLAAGWDKIWIF